jgi:hypothetical protein
MDHRRRWWKVRMTAMIAMIAMIASSLLRSTTAVHERGEPA